MARVNEFILSDIKPSSCLVLMEHFKDFKQLQDAIACSNECSQLLKKDHATKRLDLFCQGCAKEVCKDCIHVKHINHPYTVSSTVIDEEVQRVEGVEADIAELLEETRQQIFRIREVKQTIRDRKEKNINMTREVFATLRKAIDEQEEQIITDLHMESNKRKKVLELQLESLVLLWSQLKSIMEIMKKTKDKETVKVVDLINRRKLLEQRRDHLRVMGKGTMFDPVKKEVEIMFEGVEQLLQEVNSLRPVPMDLSKCEAAVPPLIVNEQATLILRINDLEDNLIFQPIKNYIAVEVKECDRGIHKVLFTPSKCSNHMMSILANGHHIPGSPYKIPVDRDYSKITEQDCCLTVTHYGENMFGNLNDVTIGPNNEIVIADNSNRCVVVLDDKFNLLAVIGQRNLDSKLVKPVGVAVTENVIAVSDQYLCQVKKYTLRGGLLSVLGCPGTGNGQFFNPKGLAFNNNNFLHVLDGGNHRVQVFQSDNAFSFSFGSEGSGPGQFQFPGRIAIDSSNNILVSDNFSNCIHLFNCNGRFIKKIDCYRPWAIAISPTGYIITVDDDIITIWSPTHHLIHQFGKIGSQKGEFIGIRGMAIGSTGDIYVVEGYNKRLQVIGNKST